ncbi:MAG: hypothetical protein WCK02_00520 [Bacteroidota bacterium]
MNGTSTFNYLSTSGKAKSLNNNSKINTKMYNPDEFVISNILNYSKSLSVLKTKNFMFSLNQN